MYFCKFSRSFTKSCITTSAEERRESRMQNFIPLKILKVDGKALDFKYCSRNKRSDFND
jgi:hypothetical protein